MLDDAARDEHDCRVWSELWQKSLREVKRSAHVGAHYLVPRLQRIRRQLDTLAKRTGIVNDGVDKGTVRFEPPNDCVDALFGGDVGANRANGELCAARFLLERTERLVVSSGTVDDVARAREVEGEGMAEPAGGTSDEGGWHSCRVRE